MQEFKLGDRIRQVENKRSQYTLSKGGVYEVTYLATPFMSCQNVEDPTDYWGGIYMGDCELATEIKEDKMSKDEWTFGITSLTALDGEELQGCVSKKNPLALIEFEDRRFVVIHDSIVTKCIYCKMGAKYGDQLDELLEYTNVGDLYEVNMEDIKEVVDIVKKIKYAPYKKEYRNSGQVTVKLLTV